MGKGSASFVYWELATITLKESRGGAETTVSGSPFQPGLVLGNSDNFLQSVLENDSWECFTVVMLRFSWSCREMFTRPF